jgi:hypothetical protein
MRSACTTRSVPTPPRSAFALLTGALGAVAITIAASSGMAQSGAERPQPGAPAPAPTVPPPPRAETATGEATGATSLGYDVAPQSANAPQYYYASDETLRPYRGFTVTGSVGPAGLFGPADSGLPAVREVAVGFALRIGVGLTSDLVLTFAYEGTGTRSTSVAGESSWLRQTNWLIGMQYYPTERLYLRGGIGAGYLTERSQSVAVGSDVGFAAGAALGWELMQARHLALAIELRGSSTVVPSQSWHTLAVNLGFSFF